MQDGDGFGEARRQRLILEVEDLARKTLEITQTSREVSTTTI
jgi:hypothetical protein